MVKFYQRVGLFTSTKATISPSTYSPEQAKKVHANITSFNINFAGLSAAQLAQKISLITHGSAKLVTRADSKRWTRANRHNKKNIRFTPLTSKSLPLRVIFPAKKDKVKLEAKPTAPLLPYLTPVVPSAQTVVTPVANRSLPPLDERKNPKKKKKHTKKPVKKLGVKKSILKRRRRRGPVNPNAWKRKYLPKRGAAKEAGDAKKSEKEAHKSKKDAKKSEKDAKKKVGKKPEQKAAPKKVEKKPEVKKDAPKPKKGEAKKEGGAKPAPVKKDGAKAKPEGGAKKAAPKPAAKKEAAKPKEQHAKPVAKKEAQPKGEGKKGGEPAKKK